MDAMHNEAVKHWVDKLDAAECVIREIAHHPIDNRLSAAVARQKAIDYCIKNAIAPASRFDKEE
jgi:hypothetical protein